MSDEFDTMIRLKHGKVDLSEECWKTYPYEFLHTYYPGFEDRTDFISEFVLHANPRPMPGSVVEVLRANLRQYYQNKQFMRDDEAKQLRSLLILKFQPIRFDQDYVDSLPEMVKLRVGNVYPASFAMHGNIFTVSFLEHIYASYGRDLEIKLMRFLFYHYDGQRN